MQSLEKYIYKNRDRFDLEEPEPGHFERFMEKQRRRGERHGNFSWKYLLQAAAVAVLIVISSLWVYEKISGTEENPTRMTLADIAPEYREAEIYYTSMINSKYNEIRSIDFPGNTSEQDMLLKELSEMDTIYKSLEEELNTENGNHMVINAMIRHYQLKLDIMSRILDQLYQVHSEQKPKTEDDEDISI